MWMCPIVCGMVNSGEMWGIRGNHKLLTLNCG